MKSYLILFSLAVLAMGFASCSLLDVEVDTEYTATLNIFVEEPVMKSTTGVAFSASSTVNPDENEEVEEYGHLIENYDVSEIVAVVTSVNQIDELDVVFLAGSTFSIQQGSTTASWTMGTDWPVEVGTIFEMENLGDAYGMVADILLTLDPFNVTATGETNVGGVSITMDVTIRSTLTANPLN